MVEDRQEHSKGATPGFALSIVIPVYNGAGSIPELIGASRNFRSKVATKLYWSMMLAQTTVLKCART